MLRDATRKSKKRNRPASHRSPSGTFERLPSRHCKASLEELSTIARRAAAHVKHPYLDHGDFLYDENGLPK